MENEIYFNNINLLMNHITIPEIESTRNFWLIRSEGGLLYDHYTSSNSSNNFVSLAWNEILRDDIDYSYENEGNMETIKNKIEAIYEINRPGDIFNKIDNFVNNVNNGDYIVIPDKSNKQITFAIAGDYYEVGDDDISSEAEFKALRESHYSGIFKEKCPYKKRRHINIVKKVEKEFINPVLLNALSSVHGISNMDKYSDFILSSIYPVYSFNEKVTIVFKVRNKDDILAIPYIKLLSKIITYLGDEIDTNELIYSGNLNSPGDFKFSLPELLSKNKTKFSKSSGLLLLIIALNGGSFMGFETPGIIPIVMDYRKETNTITQENKTQDLERILLEKNIEITKLKKDKLLHELDSDKLENLKEISKFVDDLGIDRKDYDQLFDEELKDIILDKKTIEE